MGTAGRVFVNFLVVLIALAGGFYQFKAKPILERLGWGRTADAIGNGNCEGVPELKACEKIVLHQPSGILYLACSTPETRVKWLPPTLTFNDASAAGHDYLATYNPSTKEVTRLTVSGFADKRGLSLVGLDVVPSASDSSILWVYTINHRPPLSGNPSETGADPAVEVFQTTLGGTKLQHVRTVADDKIIAPNDVIGSDDGKRFYITNDHGSRIGWTRDLGALHSAFAAASIVHCHVDEGCTFAMEKMQTNNGIAQAPNGTIYAVNQVDGGLRVLEKQADNTLILIDEINVDRMMDNVMVDSEGHVWAAAFPNALTMLEHVKNPALKSPTTVFRFSINTGHDAFFGHKYKVDRVFEDDGTVASGTTSAAYDAEKGLLFLHGVAAPRLTICKL